MVKTTPDGTVVYSSYFGGALGNSGVTGIATDPSGKVYLTGYTDASDFPTTPGLPASPVTGHGLDPVYGVFAAKLSSTGANNYCGTCQLTLTVGETSITETVQDAGTSPGLIDGLMQINFVIPTALPFNSAWVYFTPPGYTQPIQLGWVDVTQ